MLVALKRIFLEYHQAKGFKIYDSFPLVINDPTVLFTNATITPFKTMFTGAVRRDNYALVQKCLRLGGAGGSLETARENTNYTSLFEMIGSGLFDVSKDDAVDYLVELLRTLGLPQERLVFTTLHDIGFDSALERAGVASHQIILFDGANESVHHEWSFGEGDLHGCGVTVRYLPDRFSTTVPEQAIQVLSQCIEIGRLVHIDGVVCGSSVESFQYSAYDMGIGLSRIEIAIHGNCELSMQPLRIVSDCIRHGIPEISQKDAHYMANLYRIIETLLDEGLLPGKKKQAYVLRKVMRSLIEEVWLQSGRLVNMSSILPHFIGVLPSDSLLITMLVQEEGALRALLKVATKKQQKYSGMSKGELRATFGIRHNLLGIQD